VKAQWWWIVALVAVGGPERAGAAVQPPGVARMAALFGGRTVRLSGPGSVRWLPGGRGYLVEEVDSVAGLRLHAVDPVSGTRSAWLPRRAEERLVSEHGRLSGRPTRGLPFRRFEFARNGAALTYTADGARYLFAIDSAALHRLPLPARTGPLDAGTAEPGAFSPDFRRYAFIRDYDNLYLFDPTTGSETRVVQGTSEDNLVGFLGVGPWFVWSPDGRRIGYVRAEQRRLHSYPFLRDLDRHATVESSRYPFATDSNPTLELRIVEAATGRDVLVTRTTEETPFLRDLTWLPDGTELTYQLFDQWESRLELRAADATTGRSRTILVEADSAALDPVNSFQLLSDGKRFLWASERSGWRHLYLYDVQGRELARLTSGDMVINQVLAVDERRGVVTFAAVTNDGLEQHLFRVGLDGSRMERLTPEPGWHSLSADPAGRFVLDRHSALDRPTAVVLRSIDGALIRPLATSDTTGLHALGVAPPELLRLRGADGTELQGLLFKPADYDPRKRYPVIVSIYGGPHTKAIRNRFETDDGRAAIAQLGFLVLEVDGRGTMDRGKAFRNGNYLAMGQTDVDDQAAAVRALFRRSDVDSTRVGITGISHGGYLTLMAMLRYPDIFRVGVSQAPITDLRNGPRQYIGRIMRTPSANPDGYARADAVARARDLKGRLLVSYGTMDHNAVPANVMQFLRALIDAGRPFDVAVYPQGVHVLEGKDAPHGMKTMLSYFLEHLRPDGWEASRAALWQ